MNNIFAELNYSGSEVITAIILDGSTGVLPSEIVYVLLT